MFCMYEEYSSAFSCRERPNFLQKHFYCISNEIKKHKSNILKTYLKIKYTLSLLF